jgi:hypothetical protein
MDGFKNKMNNKFKQDKGQAGLTILLSVVTMLFVIGLLVMIFSLMGTSLKDSTYDKLTAGTVVNDSNAKPTTGGINLSKASLRDGACGTITAIKNGTGAGGISIGLGNITQSGCTVTNATSVAVYGATWLYSYPYTFSADNTATRVMNDTTTSIATTTDWFDIFIVITAMVVLILLTVIIITAIRSSGMIGGSTTGANSVGTA